MHRTRRTDATVAPPALQPRLALAGAVLATLALVTGAVSLAVPAQAQVVVGTQQQAVVDPPGRVARLGHFDGNVSQQTSGDNDWDAAQLNYPLTAGDRLATDASGRAELHLGSTALRLGAGTQLEFAQLDDNRAFLTVMQGTLSLRVRQLFQGQHLEVNTPNLAFSITQPGEYRVDVDPAGGITRVASFEGGGVVYGEGGQTQMVGSPQQIRFTGRNLVQVSASNGVPRDAFDQWSLARDRQEDQSQSAQYVSREMVGYQQLDAYGSWSTDPALGPIWYPRVTVADWAPYRYGRWAWVAPWGWTWVDDAPWGFAPSHYGRWTQVGPRWAWVPGPRVARPYYAPALVAFVGGSSGGVNWSLSIGGGRQPGVGWFPLAPGEAYRPYYRTSNTYITQINRTVIVNNDRGGPPPGYRFQRPDSVTAWGADDFRRGRPSRGDFHRVTQADLDRSRPGVIPDVRPPPGIDPNARPGGNDRPWNNGSRPGWQTAPQRPGDDRQADIRRPGDDRRPDDRRPDFRPGDGRPNDGRPGDGRAPDGRPGFTRPQQPQPQPQPVPDLAEQQRRQIERMESRGSLTLEQRQQIQQQHEQQRRALAEQQQQQLQNGAQRQQWEQQQRVQRQQDEQRERVERQQRDMQDRVRRQQADQQERVRQQQMNLQQQQQMQQQQRERQLQLDQQRAAFEQQRQQEQQRHAQREQAMQQERAARQQQEGLRQQEAQRQREAQQQQQQQQVQRGPQRVGPEGPRPDRPRREERGDEGRPGRG